MPREVFELYIDLEENWSREKLTSKFKERINDHLKVNPATRDKMLQYVDKISAEYESKVRVKWMTYQEFINQLKRHNYEIQVMVFVIQIGL